MERVTPGWSRTTRIAHVSTSDLAIKYLLKNQLRGFQRAGYEVVGVSSPGRFESELRSETFGYECLPIARRIYPPADLRTYLEMKTFFRKHEFDLVHTHTNKAGVLGCWAARAAGVERIATTVHGFYFHEHMHPATRSMFVELYRLTFRRIHRVFVQSAEDADTAVRLRIAPPEKLVLIGNGIDLAKFDPTDALVREEGVRLRRQFNIPDSALLVGIVTRINHEKGLRELLGAMQRITAGRTGPAHLVIIGDGPARPTLERLASDSGVSRVVHFTGYQDNIPAWLSAMDVFTLPSYREGFPRTLCEAFAMGVPSVATRIRGCRELIAEGETGLLVPRKDEIALGDALEKLLEDPQLRRRLGSEARSYSLRYLDEQIIIQKILSVYEEMGLRPRPGARLQPIGGPAAEEAQPQAVTT